MITTSRSPKDSENEIVETTEFMSPIMVTSDAPKPNFQTRIDMYRLITIWDGVGNSGTISPFNWSNNHGYSTSDF